MKSRSETRETQMKTQMEYKIQMIQNAKQNLRYTYSGTIDGIRSDELFNIRIRPFGDGFITIDKFGVVVEDGKPFAPVIFPAFPVPPEERR